MRYCAGTDDDGHNTYNVLDATLAAHVPEVEASLQRVAGDDQRLRAVRQGDDRRGGGRPRRTPSPTDDVRLDAGLDLHAAGSAARRAAGLRPHRWPARRGAVRRRRRRAARAARGRRPAQRGRQGDRLGACARTGCRCAARCCWCPAAPRSSSPRRQRWPESLQWQRFRRRRRSPSTSPTGSG